VQQQSPDLTSWTTVATGSVATDGSFTVAAQLARGGTYRVSVGPASGYAQGATAPQVVAR
jgi:hypothetical protein